ncbi:hypothetical protein RHMOL_Rhmol08G0055000 [Rhododendron molle]|uniref:Uncharacterized protein n=1 Tax=Rhododendron molle TaxID=49168 RepID=A0ACC0MM03_RHOML|nr:hypothetical protein RHMOL_Rhmol08G0055000 [Rhododendron molle]
MATGKPLTLFSAACVIFAMLVLAGLSEGASSPTPSPSPSPAPAPAPAPQHSSANSCFSPHDLFMSTLLATLALISPFFLSSSH